MKHVLVVPAIHAANTRACLESLDPAYLARVYLIDNTDDRSILDEWEHRVWAWHAPMRNLGVAASWNSGCRAAFEAGATFATLTSTSMRFWSDGGRALCATADFAAEHDQWLHGFESLNGWHLFTMGAKTFEAVGPFEEAFWPAYYEDNDYIWRMRVAGILPPAGPHTPDRKIPWIPTLRYDCETDGYALKSGKVTVDLEGLRTYYVRKWGGPPGEEQWPAPFLGPAHDFSYPVVGHG